jgi:hypothetical protein
VNQKAGALWAYGLYRKKETGKKTELSWQEIMFRVSASFTIGRAALTLRLI